MNLLHDFGDGAIKAMRLPNGSIIADSASVSGAVKLGARCVVGAAVEIQPECDIGDDVYIGSQSRIESRSCIAPNGIIGKRNAGHLHAVVPGGPFCIDAHYLRDGTLWFTVGCESHPLDVWERDWEKIALKHAYGFSPIVVALFPVARLLSMPDLHA